MRRANAFRCIIARGITKGGKEIAEAQEVAIPTTKEQYNRQKLRQLDDVLNLNTYTHETKRGERRVNSKFIEISPKPKKEGIGRSIMARVRQVLRSSRAAYLPLIRSPELIALQKKTELKPIIPQRPVFDIVGSHYDYLLNSERSDPSIQEFLALEKVYADAHLSRRGNRAFKTTRLWFQEFNEFYSSYPYFSDRSYFMLSSGSSFALSKVEFQNLATMLQFDHSDDSTIIAYDQILEHLLGFKDDFSYFICRKLKNIVLNQSHVQFITIASRENFIGLGFEVEDKHVTIIKNIETNTYANFYFNRQLDLFGFEEHEPGLVSVVYKEAGSDEIKRIPLKQEYFQVLRPETPAIDSIAKYMRDNQERLAINPIDELCLDAELVLKLDSPNATCAFITFGDNHFLKVSEEGEQKFSIFYIARNRCISVGVK